MVSPYLEAAATRAGIGFKDAPAPRTQQEAGIEFAPWERRERPLKPWLRIAGEVLIGAVLALGLLMLVL